MVNKTRIKTDAGPPALGTYSQAIRTGDLVFVTAQTGRDPDTGKLEEGLEAQTRRTSTRYSTRRVVRRLISSRSRCCSRISKTSKL
jgi:enamine deaminase RidA (YjgF/YER057c/UK114 family)